MSPKLVCRGLTFLGYMDVCVTVYRCLYLSLQREFADYEVTLCTTSGSKLAISGTHVPHLHEHTTTWSCSESQWGLYPAGR